MEKTLKKITMRGTNKKDLSFSFLTSEESFETVEEVLARHNRMDTFHAYALVSCRECTHYEKILHEMGNAGADYYARYGTALEG